jgi:hypothetical protein
LCDELERRRDERFEGTVRNILGNILGKMRESDPVRAAAMMSFVVSDDEFLALSEEARQSGGK